MKPLRNILIFLSVLGVFFIALNVHFFAKRQELGLCKPDDVTRLLLENPRRTLTAELIREKDGWWVSYGDLFEPGDEETLHALSRVVCRMPYVEKFTYEHPLTPEELKAYGFTPLRAKITVRHGDQEDVLSMGDYTPSGTEFYAMTSKDPQVIFTIANSFDKGLVTVGFLDVVLRQPFATLPQGGQLKISFGDKTLELSKGQGDAAWQDTTGKIDAAKLQPLLQSIQYLTYSKFKGPLTAEERAQHGVDFPDVTIAWQKTAGQGPAQIFKLMHMQGYLLVTDFEGEPHIFFLATAVPERLFKELNEFL